MALKVVCLLLTFALSNVFSAESPCTTPNGETANCKDLSDCDILLQAVASKDPSLATFLKASSCGPLMMCCGTFSNFTKTELSHEFAPSDVLAQNRNTTKNPHEEQDKKKLLASKDYCGFQHYDDYLHDENETLTSVNEFPWLLYISLYNQVSEGLNETYELRCAGVIISSRYAVTATECNSLPFETVRIGQHDRFKDNHCDELHFEKDCNDPFLTVAVEEKIQSNNGILLMRFAKKIYYTDFIRPICLPLEEVDRPNVGDELISSGWGDVTLEDSNVKTKKRVKHVLREPYGSDLIYVNSINYTDCFGDEGGPLMHRNKGYNWIVDSIIPPYFCLKNTPARGINQETIEWILENIRP